jgi:hypothetical protein
MAMEPADIRDVWTTVREGLEIVKKTTNPPWIPEDIYSCCVSQQAFLYMDPERTRDGFAIVQSQFCPFERISKFLLWVVYDPEFGTADHYVDEWEDIAMKTGHDAVEFVTPIEAIGRLTSKHGYQKVSSLYRKDL